MKPLREQFDATDANERTAATLLAKVPPLEPSVSRMRRVRVKIYDAPHARVMPLIRTAAIGAVLLAGVTASAMAGRAIFASKSEEPAVTTPPAVVAPPPARVHKAPVATPPEPVATEVDALPAEESNSNGNGAQRTRVNPNPAASNPGAKLMMQAMKARRDGDATRAAELLKEYRRKYPEGTMQEEALALSIEAAATRGDTANAARMARQYLERYPQGRFRDQAQRVLRSAPQR